MIVFDYAPPPPKPDSPIIAYYRKWPHGFCDGLPLYSRIRRCMVLDRPTWVIDGTPVGCQPYRAPDKRAYQLWRHFDQSDYVCALRSLVLANPNDPYFIRLREREFDAEWRHRSEPGYVSDAPWPDMSCVVF